ncbi:MAG: hypothetical protein GKR90_03505 [Pseudomonadales bacterium]|nr:hypothetical protein [Pseudomonadales bacterium]
MALEVDVFKSPRRDNTYLMLPADASLDSVPEQLQTQFGEAKPFLRFKLDQDRHLAQADPQAVLAAIQSQGFYLQLPPNKDETGD